MDRFPPCLVHACIWLVLISLACCKVFSVYFLFRKTKENSIAWPNVPISVQRVTRTYRRWQLIPESLEFQTDLDVNLLTLFQFLFSKNSSVPSTCLEDFSNDDLFIIACRFGDFLIGHWVSGWMRARVWARSSFSSPLFLLRAVYQEPFGSSTRTCRSNHVNNRPTRFRPGSSNYYNCMKCALYFCTIFGRIFSVFWKNRQISMMIVMIIIIIQKKYCLIWTLILVWSHFFQLIVIIIMIIIII